MYLSKEAKKMLKIARSSNPHIQNSYSAYTIAKELTNVSEHNSLSIVAYLEKEGYVQRPLPDTRPDLFELTELGRHFHEYTFKLNLDFFKRSILCPIAITLITEAVIHAVPKLLQLQ